MAIYATGIALIHRRRNEKIYSYNNNLLTNASNEEVFTDERLAVNRCGR